MRILGIETSCDDTGVALYEGGKGLLAHALYSQTELHTQYGGVVPELASRDHIIKLLPLVQEVLKEAKLQPKDIDGIAYTRGPGLMGALLVGATFAEALGFSLSVPTIPVHHMEAHLLAALLETPCPDFPFLALLVSGGHTLLVEAKALGEYRILGESLDDAAGEAFDKTAKLLGLGYPGGPEIAKIASKGKPKRFDFPRPLTEKPGLDFSFSGLKTFTLNTFKATAGSFQDKADIAAAFEEAVAETLLIKCRRALEDTGLNQVVVAGGVGANQRLRQKLASLKPEFGATLYYPRPQFCTDNGAMVAYTGYLYLQKWRLKTKNLPSPSYEIKVAARLRMDTGFE